MHASISGLSAASRSSCARVFGVREIVHRLAEGFGRAEDVGLYDGRVGAAALGEEIAAEEELARLVEDEAAIPRALAKV